MNRHDPTYYYSSLFFPKSVKKDVLTLYTFVKTADDLIDKNPPEKSAFLKFYRETKSAKTHNRVIVSFLKLAGRKGFRKSWYVAFLDSMKSDLSKKSYRTYAELERYMYGSAEVIGLMMAKIMDLPDESYEFAKSQGKAMRLIHFIRDVREDADLGRHYLRPEKINYYLNMYNKLQKEAEEGYRYIPRDYLVPIKSASNINSRTAQQIADDPSIIYRKFVGPTRPRVVAELLYNALML